jgi:hypothetical protein
MYGSTLYKDEWLACSPDRCTPEEQPLHLMDRKFGEPQQPSSRCKEE